ncbi:MAG TPA: lipopolysaccharide biosynthesis protein [Chitinophagaceae bacterium]|nr:lipopolysaccharide biosynthesis protein [Chitinophagaceae bacterium]
MVDQNNTPQIDNDEISLKELVLKIKEWYQFFLTKWKLIVLAGIIGGLIGFTYAYFQKPTYKAVLTFALEEEKSGGGMSGLGGLASQFGFDIGGSGGGAFAGSNLIELMKSRLLVEKTLLNPIEVNGKTISIAEYYIQINKMREAWDENPAFKNIQFLPNADRASFTLQQDSILKGIFSAVTSPTSLTIGQKDKKVSITSIEVVSSNENFSKIFCENLAKETSEYYVEIKSKKARLNVEILQHQVDSVRGQFNTSINEVAFASDGIFNLNPALKSKGTQPAKRQVDLQINTTMLTSLVSNLEMSKMALRKETPLIQVIDKPIFPLEKEKVGKLKSLVLGGFLAGFLTVLYLVFSSLYKKLIA